MLRGMGSQESPPGGAFWRLPQCDNSCRWKTDLRRRRRGTHVACGMEGSGTERQPTSVRVPEFRAAPRDGGVRADASQHQRGTQQQQLSFGCGPSRSAWCVEVFFRFSYGAFLECHNGNDKFLQSCKVVIAKPLDLRFNSSFSESSGSPR